MSSGAVADFALLLVAVVSIFAVGLAVAGRIANVLGGVATFAYAAAAGVTVQALFGLAISLLPRGRHVIVAADGIIVLAAVADVVRKAALVGALRASDPATRVALIVWLVFAFACVAIARLDVRLPGTLPDWRYVFKTPTTNVKLQYLTMLPADNIIPYLVTEFLLRRISFERERPLLPNQEVSNRTVLLSLVAIPYRVAFLPPRGFRGDLGAFEFVGRRWPNVARLYNERAYRQVLVIGIFCNSLLLVGVLALLETFKFPSRAVASASVLAATTPYLICQTIFIWPKAFAAFFLLLAWHAARRRLSPIICGLCAALAFHCHPYAIVYVGGVTAWMLIRWWRRRETWQYVMKFGATVALLLLPWFAWTHLVLRIQPDLFWQSFAGPQTALAWSTPINFVWIRGKVLFELLTPGMFAVYPFDPAEVSDAAVMSLWTAVGLVLFLPGCAAAYVRAQRELFVIVACVLPALALTLLFSFPARPIVQGFQPLVPLLIFGGVAKLREHLSNAQFVAAVSIQLAINFAVIAMRAAATGAHFS